MIEALDFQGEKIPISIAHKVREQAKEYIWYPFLRKKYIYKDQKRTYHEEKLRAYVVKKLIIDYGYDPRLISFENIVYNTGRLDILLRSNNQTPYAVFEIAYEKSTKQLNFDFEKGVEEARKLKAKYFVQVSKHEWKIYNVEKNKYEAKFPMKFGLTKEFKYIKGKRGKDLADISIETMNKIFRKIHDILWGQGELDPLDALEVAIELLIAKKYDEKYTEYNKPYKFQVAKVLKDEENEYEIVYRISSIIDELFNKRKSFIKKTNINLLDNKIRILSNNNENFPQRLKKVVKIMEGYRLSSLQEDKIGHAFELFLSSMFRGPYGQYFTPPSIVALMVNIANPKEDDFIIDLSAGSGRILQYAMEYVKEKFGKLPRTFKVLGVDIYEKIVKFANKYFLLITEDMETGLILQADSLRDSYLIEEHISRNAATIAITNPPLSKKQDSILHVQQFKKKESGSEKKKLSLSVLFIEEYLKYLKDGGLLITVIDDGVLNTKSYTHFRRNLFKKYHLVGVIRLARHTFTPSGADIQTSVLILSKKGGLQKHSYVRDKVFFAHLEDVGFDSTGRPAKSAVHYIISKFSEFVKGKNLNESLNSNIVFTLDRRIVENSKNFRLDFGYYYHMYIAKSPIVGILKRRDDVELLPLSDFKGVKVFKGKTFKRREYTYEETSVFSIKATNINETGIVTLNSSTTGSFVKEEAIKEDLIRGLTIENEDLLILCSAHNPKYIYRKIAVFDEEMIDLSNLKGKAIIPSGEIIVVRQSEVHPYYLLWILKSSLKNLIMAGVTGISGHIYEEDILPLNIPITKNAYEIGEFYKNKITKLKKLQEEQEKLMEEIRSIEKYLYFRDAI